MNENRKRALVEYFKDKFLNVDFAKAFEAGWDAAMKHYFKCGQDMFESFQDGSWLDPNTWKEKDCPECHGHGVTNHPEFQCSTCSSGAPEPDGWLIWDEHNGRVFVEHPKGQHPNDVRLKLEQFGKPVLGAVVFKDWPNEAKTKP